MLGQHPTDYSTISLETNLLNLQRNGIPALTAQKSHCHDKGYRVPGTTNNLIDDNLCHSIRHIQFRLVCLFLLRLRLGSRALIIAWEFRLETLKPQEGQG